MELQDEPSLPVIARSATTKQSIRFQLDCRGRLRLPRNDKPGSSAAERRIQPEIRCGCSEAKIPLDVEPALRARLRCAQNDKQGELRPLQPVEMKTTVDIE